MRRPGRPRRIPRRIAVAVAVGFALATSACTDRNPVAPDGPDEDERLSGGGTTIFNATSQAFTFPAPNLGDLERHREGDAAFDAAFVAAPATVQGGLGPLFNLTSCVACHISNGRGSPPEAGADPQSLLLRLSVPGVAPDGGPNPAPGFGTQLNDEAVFGVAPEARVQVSYVETAGAFADGEPYHLRAPVFTLVDSYIPLPPDLLVSARLAPPVFGRGLLEAVDEQTILDLADEGDVDGDGISGRPNYVRDVGRGEDVLGRFGWKANQPTLDQQAAAAYRNDMGVTNPLFPTESTDGQLQDDGRGDDPELDAGTVAAAAFYTRTLAVPARRDVDDPVVRRGEELFRTARCAVCHVPTLTTGRVSESSVSQQRIHPYTDLLLHDMGDGLADGRPDFRATGREWRTPPLWGLGLTEVVQGEVRLLHDGRARSFSEAILWHGGEAESAADAFRSMPSEAREALLEFLRSL